MMLIRIFQDKMIMMTLLNQQVVTSMYSIVIFRLTFYRCVVEFRFSVYLCDEVGRVFLK